MICTLLAFLFHAINNRNNPMNPKINMDLLGVAVCLDFLLALAIVVFT